MNIVAKWPGSTHDSFILENSALKDMFERGAIPEGWLLGDSGYPPAALAAHSSAEPNNQTRGEIQRVSHQDKEYHGTQLRSPKIKI